MKDRTRGNLNWIIFVVMFITSGAIFVTRDWQILVATTVAIPLLLIIFEGLDSLFGQMAH